MDLLGRSLLKEIDFTKDEFLYLIDLAAQLQRREAGQAPQTPATRRAATSR